MDCRCMMCLLNFRLSHRIMETVCHLSPAKKKRKHFTQPLRAQAGMENANGVLTLMMDHHWVQKKIPNVALMTLHKAGRYYHVPDVMKEKRSLSILLTNGLSNKI